MTTTTLYKFIQSELIKTGKNEFDNGKKATDTFPFGDFIYYDSKYQFTEKVLNFDSDVQKIVEYLFHGYALDVPYHDEHFKKTFLMRFINRQINRQTIEAFKFELINTFLTYEEYINRVYRDSEMYINQKKVDTGTNNASNKGTTKNTNLNDVRSAFVDLPQDEVNINVDSVAVKYASDNTISRSRTKSDSENDSITKGTTTNQGTSYDLDVLVKSSRLFEDIMKKFDAKCFLQFW